MWFKQAKENPNSSWYNEEARKLKIVSEKKQQRKTEAFATLQADSRLMQQEHDRIKMLILSNQKPAQHESVRARQPSAYLVDQGDFWMGLVAEPSAKLCTNPLCLRADIWVGDRGCIPCLGAAAEERAAYPVVMEGHRESLWNTVLKAGIQKKKTTLPLFLVPENKH